MSSLAGRVALVTGASQGIGRACALALAERGATVALCARSEAKLAEVAAEINGWVPPSGETPTTGAAHCFALDVGSEDSIKECVKGVVAQLGKVDILVNNAGITRDILALRMKRKDWDDVLTTNLTGAFLMTQACMSSMLKGRWGRVINITSVVGETGQAGQANYAASKAGLIGLTKSLAQELGSRNITVNAVAPGFIETDMTHVLKEEQKVRITQGIPLGRIGRPEEVAAAVRFLCGEDAGYITGNVIDVNGGMYMR
jgi:3-oxoacyl-[acyl-carrier protein] reductase